jgi:hypothetical protein
MNEPKDDKPRILVDSDWKEEAAREKEQLAEQVGPKTPQGELAPDILSHCASLATQALVFLGLVAHPLTGKPEYSPQDARYLIDTLLMLREKTKGNLTAEEAEHLEAMVGELQMAWVQVTAAARQAATMPDAKGG